MSQTGLSYAQAPPFGLPLRFFLTAPLFLLLAAVAAIPTAPDWTADSHTLATIALVHLVTLGFLGMVMQGALLQMLPVVIGTPVPATVWVARLGHVGLTLGTPLLAAGLYRNQAELIHVAMAALTLGWLPFLAAAAVSLTRARTTSGLTLIPMRLAWLAALLTVVLGLWLASLLAGDLDAAGLERCLGLHVAWGLGGWVLILVMGVAYQVVPMLQITPPYPARYARWAAWVVFAALGLLSLANALELPGLGELAYGLVGASLAGFGLVTLDLQRRRRRRLTDATLMFWRLGMLSLLVLAPLPWLYSRLPCDWQAPMAVAGGVGFLLGFAASVVSGMLYKIVPFLAWFHLQSQTHARAGSIPNMKEFLPDGLARRHWWLHLAAVLWLLPAPWLPPAYAAPGLLLLALSAHVLWRNLLGCVRLFRHYGGRLHSAAARRSLPNR